MISKKIEKALQGSSAIRAMFVEGKQMAEKYGAENVYDFSLGNPATPAPAAFNTAIKELVDETDPLVLHGYMENAGYTDVRAAIAENLNKRFGTKFDYHNVTMTVGAAGGALIVNTPNNPTGVIYKPETMRKIAEILEKKQTEIGHDIYLISDEPYRELVYDGNEVDFLTKYYKNTIVGYSFSKSLSLPGERIGYVVVPDEASDAEDLIRGIEISNRTLGFVNAPSLLQKAVARCLEEQTDVAFYDKNRTMLYEGLTKLGFTCIKPEGAFYLWVKSPVENEEEFVTAGKKYHLLMVKGSAFGCGGYVRLAYCVSPETIQNSMQAFAKLAAEYQLQSR